MQWQGRGCRSGWGRGQGTQNTRCKLMRGTFIPALDLLGSTIQTNPISNVSNTVPEKTDALTCVMLTKLSIRQGNSFT